MRYGARQLTTTPARISLSVRAELNTYSDCVDANPSSWQVVCADRKAELTACAAKCSGLVNSLKQRCKDEILQYERCLQANSGMPDTCVPQLERLWYCANYLMGMASRSGRTAPGLWGPWVSTDTPAWAGGYTLDYK